MLCILRRIFVGWWYMARVLLQRHQGELGHAWADNKCQGTS